MSEAGEAAEDLEKLAAAAKAAQEQIEKSARAAEVAGQKLSKLKELSIGALGGEETVEKYNKAKEAVKLAGDSSLTTGQRMLAGGAAARYAAGAVGALATGFAQFADEARKASADLYLHEQRVRALAPAYDSIRSATGGAADVQANFTLQQELLARGFRTTEAQAASLARATREYARDNQVSQTQAAAAITAALDGDAAAAARFGVSLNGATTSGERFTAVTRQLAESQRGVAVATQDAAERARVQDEASGRAWATVKKYTYAISGIGAVDEALSGIVQLWDGATSSTRAATAATVGLTTVQQAQVRLAQERKALEEATLADTRRAAALQQSSAAEELQRLGERVSGLGRVVTAQEQYTQAVRDASLLSQRASESNDAFDARRLATTNALITAVRRKKEEQDRADESAQAQRQLSMLAAQIRAHGGIVDARIRSLTPAQRYAEIQREIADFSERENESTTAAANRLSQLFQESEQMRQSAQQSAQEARARGDAQRELNDLLNERENLNAKLATVERIAGESAVDRLRRLIESQRELNGLAQQGHTDAAAAFEAFRQQTRERLALDAQKTEEERTAATERARARADEIAAKDLERQTQRADANEARFAAESANSVEQRLRESFGLAQEQSTTATQAITAGAKSAADGFGELARSVFDAATAAKAAGEDEGAAAAQAVDRWAEQKAVQWGFQALEAAAGAGVAYFIRPDAVPGLLASAATYAGMAAVAGVTSAAIPNAPAASSGGAGGAGGGFGLAASSRNESASSAKAQPAIVFNLSGYTSTESAQEGVVRALREARARGYEV